MPTTAGTIKLPVKHGHMHDFSIVKKCKQKEETAKPALVFMCINVCKDEFVA